MAALEDNFELRPLVNLWIPPSTRVFPMWYQVIPFDYEYSFIDISDYEEPEPGVIYQIGTRLYEFIEVIDTHKSKGVWGDIPVPEWFRIRCKIVTGSKMRYAGDENIGKVLINLSDRILEEID